MMADVSDRWAIMQVSGRQAGRPSAGGERVAVGPLRDRRELLLSSWLGAGGLSARAEAKGRLSAESNVGDGLTEADRWISRNVGCSTTVAGARFDITSCSLLPEINRPSLRGSYAPRIGCDGCEKGSRAVLG